MNLLVTNAGLAALVNAEATGTETITISQIKFGSGQYTPTKTQTAMQTPFKTLTALSGGAVSENTLHVTAEDASTETYSVYEVGVFLSDGTLFAVGSQTAAILQKASASIALLSVDIALADHSAATVTVGDTNFFNPQATTETKGVVELATADETKAGTDATRAVTPASLKAELDDRDSKVVHTTGNETIAGMKTFTNSLSIKQDIPMIEVVQTSVTKGTAPSSSQASYLRFKDTEGNPLGVISYLYTQSKSSITRFRAYKANADDDTEYSDVTVEYPADGSPYATAPTPADANDSSTKIATTAWVQTLAGKYLPLAGGTITGSILSTINYPLKSSVDDSLLAVCGGTEWTAGAALELSGKDRSTGAGNFLLKAQNADTRANLTGKPDGTLTWNNKNIVRTVNSVSADTAGNVVIEDVTGNAGTATKLSTARTIALSGDVSGSASFDGSANVTISATVADDSHSHSNYLPLAGGAMTNQIAIKRDVSNSYLGLYGGKGEADGAELDLCGKDHSSMPGAFQLHARDASTDVILRGQVDGTLRWNSNYVLSNSFSMPVNTSGVVVNGGTDYESGGYFRVYGKSHATYPGWFTLGANDGTNASALRGLPNGTLTWNSKNVLTSDNETTLKYLIDETQFSVNALGKSFNYGLLWLCIENFEDTADVNTSIGAGSSVADYYDATNHLIVKTGSGSIVLQSKAQTCSKNNATAWAYPDWTGSGSLKVEISRDGGTTFTTVTSDTMTSISSQPTGTSMVCRLTLTGQVTLKNIAWGCK